jgi:hypothetical protein
MSQYINLNRVEYIVTYQCSSKCIHCHIAEEHPHSPAHIAPDLAIHILQEIGRQYPLDSVMTFGGEPLLYPEVVCAIHQTAKALNIPKRQIITNGSWTNDTHKTKIIAQLLADSGVNQVSISVDAFHQEHVPLERIKHTATALLEVGIREISWNPCWLVSEQDTNAYNLKTRAILDELNELPICTGDGNVVEPKGRALTFLGTYFRPTYEWFKTSCQDVPYTEKLDEIRTICVEPNGDIPICQAFRLGNAVHTPINQLLKSYNPYTNPDMQLILEEGVAGVVRKARSLGIALRDDGYYLLCDLCTSLKQAIGTQKKEVMYP